MQIIIFSHKCKEFYTKLKTEQAVSLLYHHQSNAQIEACINFLKQMFKECIDTDADPHIALLQIKSTPVGQGLNSCLKLLFKDIIRGIMPILNRSPVNTDNDDEHYETLVQRQAKTDKNYEYSQKLQFNSSRVYCSNSKRRQRTVDPWNNNKGDQSHNNWSNRIHVTKMG